ncbi:MAG: protein phosphatase CheZ [Alphaproteobacteria bacterium]|nr:protein phosphatase CheZ [Alphaproteobacteria bacterium]OJV13613.1 MAG: hypothetical protein BGO27_03250 [Alphaproteobacteria bacterium 33-17]
MIDNLGNVFLERIRQIWQQNGGKIDVADLESVVENFMEIIKTQVSTSTDVSIYYEISKIKEKLKAARSEIDALKPHKIFEQDLPGATAELAEVTKATEEATNTILDSAESIMNLASQIAEKDHAAKITDLSTKIMEACNFQDLTSQRITKVLKIFDDFDKLVNSLISNLSIEKDKEYNGDKGLSSRIDQNIVLNGPQLGKDAPNQSSIDDLFNSLGKK